MSKVVFEEDEYVIMAMFEAETCRDSIEKMSQSLPYIVDDPDMTELIQRTMQKMENLTDEEYHQIDLESYREEPEDDNEC